MSVTIQSKKKSSGKCLTTFFTLFFCVEHFLWEVVDLDVLHYFLRVGSNHKFLICRNYANVYG
jgi:hypothetical protein